jgi:hypothetical protein
MFTTARALQVDYWGFRIFVQGNQNTDRSNGVLYVLYISKQIKMRLGGGYLKSNCNVNSFRTEYVNVGVWNAAFSMLCLTSDKMETQKKIFLQACNRINSFS